MRSEKQDTPNCGRARCSSSVEVDSASLRQAGQQRLTVDEERVGHVEVAEQA